MSPLELPPEPERRQEKRRRRKHGYTHLRVTNATAELVSVLVESIDALSVDEALWYLILHEIGLERAANALREWASARAGGRVEPRSAVVPPSTRRIPE